MKSVLATPMTNMITKITSATAPRISPVIHIQLGAPRFSASFLPRMPKITAAIATGTPMQHHDVSRPMIPHTNAAIARPPCPGVTTAVAVTDEVVGGCTAGVAGGPVGGGIAGG